LLSIVLTNNRLPEFKSGSEGVFYIGVENSIPVNLNGVSPADVRVDANLGKVSRYSDSVFVFVPSSEMGRLQLKLFYKRMMIDSRNITIQPIPNTDGLSVGIDGEQNGEISFQKLSIAQHLNVKYDRSLPEKSKCKIFSFDIAYNTPGMSEFAAKGRNMGSEFTAESKRFLQTLKKGDHVYFFNISYAVPPHGQILNIGEKSLFITD
jgi:hypothetical protein